jgi:hypothetical protein
MMTVFKVKIETSERNRRGELIPGGNNDKPGKTEKSNVCPASVSWKKKPYLLDMIIELTPYAILHTYLCKYTPQ